MWTSFIWLALFGFAHVALMLETRVPASAAFDEIEYPCAANCGKGSCFPTAWDEAAAQSRNMTEGCVYVVYSVAVDDRADNFNPIGDYWGDKPCSILFLSKNSLYLQRNLGATKTGNWNIVAVDSLSGSFSNGRKASRIPKLSPGKFFAATVQYSLYIDAKLRLLKHPADILATYVTRSENVSIAMMGTFPYIRNVDHEILLIDKGRAHRINCTHDFELLLHQGEVYRTLGITGAGLAVDGAMIMSDLRAPSATQYLCMWLNQELKYSDRDQMAFQGALFYFSHKNNDTVVDQEGFRKVALDMADGRHYLRMLPYKKWWNGGGDIAHLARLSWNKR